MRNISRGNMYNISKAIMCSSSTSKANMYSSTSKANMYSTNLPLSTSCSTPTASIILHRSSVKARRWSSNNNSSNKRSIIETITSTPITRGTTTWRRTNRETTTTWRSLATKWKGTTRLATEVTTMTNVGSSTTTTTSTINTMIGEVETSSMIGAMIVDMISRGTTIDTMIKIGKLQGATIRTGSTSGSMRTGTSGRQPGGT